MKEATALILSYLNGYILAAMTSYALLSQRTMIIHIKSNMQRLGRIGIFSNTIHKFLVNLKRNYKEHFEKVDKTIVDKSFSEKALRCFSMVKPSESAKTLQPLSADLFDLVHQFNDCPEVVNMHSYKLLMRVLNEQCNVNVSDDLPVLK